MRKASKSDRVRLLLVMLCLAAGCVLIQAIRKVTTESSPPDSSPPLPRVYPSSTAPIISSTDAPLQLVLQMDRASYPLNQPIMATLALQNPTDRPVLIKNRMVIAYSTELEPLVDVVFVIENAAGERQNLSARVYGEAPGDEKFSPLQPHSSREATYDLRSYYNLRSAGTYTIYALYVNNLDAPDGRVPWKGTLVSNSLTIVVEP